MAVCRLHADTVWSGASRWARARSGLAPRLLHPGTTSCPPAMRFGSHVIPAMRHASTSSTAAGATTTAAADALGTQGSGSSSSIMDPLVPYLEQLPELLHLPPSAHSYAISIAIVTVLLRSCITLPAALWQRARTRRMVELVVPEWEKLKEELPRLVAKRCRKERKSYEEYEKTLKKEVKQELRALTSRHRCSPTPTLVLPVLVHLPLFISLSLLIRTSLLIPGSPLASELIPWSHPPADLAAKFEASAKILAERGLEGEALKKLTAMPGPTLGDVDKTMLGPLSLGLLTMINVELGQWLRRGMMTEKEEEAAKEEKEKKKRSPSKEAGAAEKFSLSPFRGNIIGNMLRTASIVFVVVSSQAPAALVVYWITSASYTLAQNTVFALVDRQRAARLQGSPRQR